jgi:hypothetical protein
MAGTGEAATADTFTPWLHTLPSQQRLLELQQAMRDSAWGGAAPICPSPLSSLVIGQVLLEQGEGGAAAAGRGRTGRKRNRRAAAAKVAAMGSQERNALAARARLVNAASTTQAGVSAHLRRTAVLSLSPRSMAAAASAGGMINAASTTQAGGTSGERMAAAKSLSSKARKAAASAGGMIKAASATQAGGTSGERMAASKSLSPRSRKAAASAGGMINAASATQAGGTLEERMAAAKSLSSQARAEAVVSAGTLIKVASAAQAGGTSEERTAAVRQLSPGSQFQAYVQVQGLAEGAEAHFSENGGYVAATSDMAAASSAAGRSNMHAPGSSFRGGLVVACGVDIPDWQLVKLRKCEPLLDAGTVRHWKAQGISRKAGTTTWRWSNNIGSVKRTYSTAAAAMMRDQRAGYATSTPGACAKKHKGNAPRAHKKHKTDAAPTVQAAVAHRAMQHRGEL